MLKKLITCTSAIIIFTLTHAQGPAADSLPQPLQEVTIIGSRYKTLSGSGVVITPVVLAKLNQPDVTKILRTVPGVNIRDEEGYGLRPNIGLRGTPVNRSAKITLMEDGILVAPAPYADPSAYYFPTVARMQGIEVLKGSSQIQYGPYTIGGALNLLSTPIPKSFSGHALASYGSFGTNQQRVWLGDSQSNLDYVFEINRLASHGFKKLDGGGNTGFDRRDVMAKLRLHTREGAKTPQSVTLKVMSMTEDGHESYLGLTYEDFKASPNRRYAATQKDRLDMNHQHASLTHTISPAIGLHLNTTAYYNRTFRNWARVNTVGGQGLNNILADPLTHALPYRIMTGQANGNITYQSAARSFQVKGLQSNLQYSFTTSQFTHRIQAGLRYHEDEADRIATQSTYAMADGTMILTAAGVTGNAENQIRSANAWATYLQYNLEYKGLTISPGLRYEKVKLGLSNYGNADNARLGTNLRIANNQVDIWLPGVGFNYAITRYMHAFGGVHKGFSPPGTPTATTTQQARMETAINYELGYRIHTSGLNAQAAWFLNQYQNILGSDNVSGGGAGTGDMFNAGSAKTTGIEINATYNLLHHVRQEDSFKMPLTLSYTYTHASFAESFVNAGGDWGSGPINRGDLIPFITPHLLTVMLGYEMKKLNATLTARYVGDTRTKPGQGNIITPTSQAKYTDVNTIAGYWVVDASVNYNFYRKLTVFSAINNLFNKAYIVANLPQGYRPGMPLSIVMGLKADF